MRISDWSSDVCSSDLGESAKLWKDPGATLQGVKDARRKESEAAAKALGAHDIEFFDLGDYPLAVGAEAKDRLVSVMRKVQPAFMLTHSKADPYNSDHPYATQEIGRAHV